jgi:hypothetical protein
MRMLGDDAREQEDGRLRRERREQGQAEQGERGSGHTILWPWRRPPKSGSVTLSLPDEALSPLSEKRRKGEDEEVEQTNKKTKK